jgi:hypothetical protein
VTRDELFYDLIKQIGEHLIKCTRLKENEDRPGHLNEEIVDIQLLSLGLLYIRDIGDESIKKAFIDLYQNVGVAFARDQYRQLKYQDDRLTKSNEDDWLAEMKTWVNTKGTTKIVSIAAQNRKLASKIIREVIGAATDEGLGSDETARAIKK